MELNIQKKEHGPDRSVFPNISLLYYRQSSNVKVCAQCMNSFELLVSLLLTAFYVVFTIAYFVVNEI